MDPSLADISVVLLQVAMGIGLAACAGLRAFLPLFVVGLAGRFEFVPLSNTFEWLASTPALVVFGVAVVTEILADKIPVVDNFLDLIQSFVKPVAGTILAASVLTELTPLQATVLGLITGGVVAGGVHLTKAKLRLASTATTVGAGNPVLSVIEDISALVGSLVSLVVPLLLVLLLIVASIVAWGVLRRRRGRSEQHV